MNPCIDASHIQTQLHKCFFYSIPGVLSFSVVDNNGANGSLGSSRVLVEICKYRFSAKLIRKKL